MRPPDFQGSGVFYDGQSAVRHEVTLKVRRTGVRALIISGASLEQDLEWPLDRLRGVSEAAGGREMTITVMAETDDEAPRDTTRLRVTDEAWADWIKQSRPGLFKRDVAKAQLWRLARRLGYAVAAVALIIFVILPNLADTLARFVPIEREVAFGRVVTEQVARALARSSAADLTCESDEGSAALNEMLSRLTANADLEYEVTIHVFDHGMVNAFAAPGGQIVLMRGLLKAVDGPDSLAAVLAHEIGHVVARDPLRQSLRAVGTTGILSVVLGDFTGAAAIALAAEQMLNSSFSRKAETKADNFAIDLLNKSQTGSEGMAAFFDLVSREYGQASGAAAYFSTHPPSGERAERARRNAEKTSESTTPILSEAQWKALQAICG